MRDEALTRGPDPASHLFIASVPVPGGLIALIRLRHWDRPAIKT